MFGEIFRNVAATTVDTNKVIPGSKEEDNYSSFMGGLILLDHLIREGITFKDVNTRNNNNDFNRTSKIPNPDSVTSLLMTVAKSAAEIIDGEKPQSNSEIEKKFNSFLIKISEKYKIENEEKLWQTLFDIIESDLDPDQDKVTDMLKKIISTYRLHNLQEVSSKIDELLGKDLVLKEITQNVNSATGQNISDTTSLVNYLNSLMQNFSNLQSNSSSMFTNVDALVNENAMLKNDNNILRAKLDYFEKELEKIKTNY